MDILMENLVSIIVAVVLSFAAGYVWYSPALFGTRWMKLEKLKKTDAAEADMKMTLGFTLVGSILAAWFINYFISLVSTNSFSDALYLSFAAFFGMSVGFSIMHHVYAQKPWELYFINTGYSAVVVFLMTAAAYYI